MLSVGSIGIDVELNKKDFERQLGGLEQSAKKFMSSASKMLGATLGIGALVKFGKACIDLGSDLAEVQNVVDVTFTKMSDQVNQFAVDAASSFGIGEKMAKQYMGTMGAMSKAIGFTEEQAFDMSKTMTGLVGDVASFYNLDHETAYEKLKSVWTGQSEGLRSLGIVMTQVALDEFALANGFGKTTAKMTEQEKVALRYAFVQDRLSLAMGDFARTSDAWANQTRLLTLQVQSLASVIGEGLIAILSPALRALNKFMTMLVKAANTFKAFIHSLFGKKSEDMTSNLASNIDDVSDAVGGIGDSASGAAGKTASAMKELKRSLFGFDQINKLDEALSDMGSGGGGGAGGISDVASALQDTAYAVEGATAIDQVNEKMARLIDRMNELKNIFTTNFWKSFGDTSVFKSIENNIINIKNSLIGIWTDKRVLEAGNDWLDSIVGMFGSASGMFASVGATIVDFISGSVSKYLQQDSEKIKGYIVEWFNIDSRINEIASNFFSAVSEIFSVFRNEDSKQIGADVLSIFSDAIFNIQLLFSKLNEAWMKLVVQPITDNKEKIKTALENTIKPISQIVNTVKKVGEDIWAEIQELWDGHISPLVDTISQALSTAFSTLLDGYNQHVAPALQRFADKFSEIYEEHIKPMIDALGGLFGAVIDWVRKTWENWLGPFVNWLAEKIGPIIADIIDFFTVIGGDLLTAVIDTITALAEGMEEFFIWLGDITEPLKEFFDQMIEGWNETWKTVKAIAQIVGDFLAHPIEMTTKVKDKGWDALLEEYKELQDKEVTVTTDGKKTNAFSFTAQEYGLVKNNTATKTVTGKTDKSFTGTSNAYTKLKNERAEKTIFGKMDNSFGTNKAKYDSVGNTTATKSLGSIYPHWNDWQRRRKEYDAVGSETATKELGAIYPHWADWQRRRKEYDAVDSETATKSLGSVYPAWSDWQRRKTEYTSVGSENAVKSLSNKFSDSTTWGKRKTEYNSVGSSTATKSLASKWLAGAKWNRDIAEYDAVKDKTATVKLDAKKTKAYTQMANNYSVISGTTVNHQDIGYFGAKKGGAFYGGKMHEIPQFAGGGFPDHGSLIWAGEAGPEILGHMNGRTEILNRSQIASTIASSVGGFLRNLNPTPQLAFIGQAMQQQAQAQIQQSNNMNMVVGLLTKILTAVVDKDTDVYFDTNKVTNEIVKQINRNTKATGLCEIII